MVSGPHMVLRNTNNADTGVYHASFLASLDCNAELLHGQTATSCQRFDAYICIYKERAEFDEFNEVDFDREQVGQTQRRQGFEEMRQLVLACGLVVEGVVG
ncbi:uncharacterized protein PHALS_10522 [Plasmopara halstedii]|uniref:Uncharacterized protein n=1 Tax=Plasmopara halstedii TaxID=4781 RepID=A0A0P1AII3_PLAHL|nr:uncharacterized protein PHALS_10522 [Plasmopara halstedii]CEG40314.1 hypothetical protein PHALS_10522 [Plasmopara halstedii]|eukprot:XP_024576683.1 hypothetical protein PHALS_10522 [Plasmopara halstedii]